MWTCILSLSDSKIDASPGDSPSAPSPTAADEALLSVKNAFRSPRNLFIDEIDSIAAFLVCWCSRASSLCLDCSLEICDFSGPSSSKDACLMTFPLSSSMYLTSVASFACLALASWFRYD